MFRINRFSNRFYLSLVFFGLLFFLACSGSSNGLKSEIVTAENKQGLVEKAKNELTYQEVELLVAYLDEKKEYAYGKTVGAILQEASSASTGGSGQAEPLAEEVKGMEASASKSAQPQESAQNQNTGSDSRKEAANQLTESTDAGETLAEVFESKPAAPPEPEEPPKPTVATLPQNTQLVVRLAQTLSSKTNTDGQKFETQLENDLVVDGYLLARSGDSIIGRLSNVKASGKVKGRASMALTLVEIRSGGENYAIASNTLSFEAEGTGGRDAKRIGIAAGIGTVVGAIAGGGKGAAIGAAVGGGAGAGATLLTSGKEVEFPVEQLFEFSLGKAVEMKILN